MLSSLPPENVHDFLIYPMLVEAIEHVYTSMVYKRDGYNFSSFDKSKHQLDAANKYIFHLQ